MLFATPMLPELRRPRACCTLRKDPPAPEVAATEEERARREAGDGTTARRRPKVPREDREAGLEVPGEDVEREERDARMRRPRVTHADATTGLDAPGPWADYDIGASARALRTTNVATLRAVLRNLHIRWWHASTLSMNRLLKRVGVSNEALALVKDIVDSCNVCREWTRPSPANAFQCGNSPRVQ